MTLLRLLNSLATRGIDLLDELHQARPAKSTGDRELAASIGFDPLRLRRLLRCANRLFGTCEDATNRDAAVVLSRKLGLSLDTVLLIDKRCGQINNVEMREHYRLEFTRAAENNDYEALDAHLRQQVKELNNYAEPPQHLRAHVSRKPDIRGMKHLQVTGPANMIDDLIAPLTVRAAEIATAHEDYSRDRCVGQAIAERLALPDFAAAGPVDAVDKLRYQPALIITARDIVDYSPRFAATSNGSVLTPGQFINALLADTGWALVYDENNQPTDLMPLHNPRLATVDQRIAMILDNPVCSWPDCERPSHAGQAHHLVARKHGGPTTMQNLTMVCAEHNATNDDDRQCCNGFLERDDGTGHIYLQPPDPRAPRSFGQSFVTALAGRAYANYRHGT